MGIGDGGPGTVLEYIPSMAPSMSVSDVANS